jgi:hypothetical protein
METLGLLLRHYSTPRGPRESSVAECKHTARHEATSIISQLDDQLDGQLDGHFSLSEIGIPGVSGFDLWCLDTGSIVI